MILIDTGILAAFLNTKDINHDNSKLILTDIIQKQYGTPIITDYILDEVVTLIYVRTKDNTLSLKIGELIIEEKFGKFVKIPEQVVLNTWETYKKYSKKGLSFTDCSLIEIGKLLNCNDIASFDQGFIGIMNVIH